MKLGVVSLLRNEADIVAPFVQHLAALFDHVVLMDHGSTDGTTAMLRTAAARPGWQCWDVAVTGYHPAAFTAFAIRHLFETTAVDHVALLDGDEFLDVPDRTALVAALAPLAGNARVVGHLPWRNCMKVHPHRALRMASPIWAAPDVSPICKVILPRPLWYATGGRARPAFGNHDIEPNDGLPIAYHRMGEILHLPLRSLTHLKLKVIGGALALRGRDAADGRVSEHWLRMLDLVVAGTLRADDVATLAARYGEVLTAAEQADRRGPAARGFTRRRLRSVAHAAVSVRMPAAADPLDQVAAIVRGQAPVRRDDLALRLRGTVLEAA